MAAKSAIGPCARSNWKVRGGEGVSEVQRQDFWTKNAAGKYSPCLWAAAMEAVPMAALGHGEDTGGDIRVPDLTNWKTRGGERVGEVQRLQFLKQIGSRGKLTLPVKHV